MDREKKFECVCGILPVEWLPLIEKAKIIKGGVLSGQHSITFSETKCALLVVYKLTFE